VIQTSCVGGLSILPCGPTPSNPAELLTSPKFQELLRSLADQYDYVLVDTPPLLAVTDPSVVVPCVDGVLLTIRVAKNGRPNAERARDVLMSLGAKVVGVVINGVSDKAFGPYGSEHYRYGYGRSYAYYTEDGDQSAQGIDGVDGSVPVTNGASVERSASGGSSRDKQSRRKGPHHPSRPRLFRWFFSSW
jgi:Mrp family chromosome partitioning ATPase